MKTKNSKITVLYIAGNGHSGSTLLDIIIGYSNPDKIFSAGELTFITRETIFDEKCSCGDYVRSCTIWSQVINIWHNKRTVDYQEYVRLWNKYDRNHNFINTFFNNLFPSKDFKTYCDNTQALFKAIQKVTGKSIIVDSSKVAPRIAMLSRISNLKIIHICRDFSGVLNSAKRHHKKDIDAGYEEELKPRNSYKTFLDWILNNTLVKLFSLNKTRYKLHYIDYVNNVNSISKISEISIHNSKSFKIKPDHLLAGNVLRLKKELNLNPEIGFVYKRLTKKQKLISGVIDKMFFFWAKR